MLTNISKEHFEGILHISNEAFGKGFITNKNLQYYLENGSSKAFVLIENNIVIGFLSISILSADQIKSNVLKDGDWFVNKLGHYNKTGFIKQVVIHPEFQKKGFGKKLIKNCTTLLAHKVDAFLCIAWMKRDTIPVEKSLTSNDFKKERTIINYWETDSLIYNYNCLVCGTPPCKCNASVYLWHKKTD
jgi:ribosomal protein S18 acetylase RimI-like enzyme